MSLLSGSSQTYSQYTPSIWSKILHSAPHINITFHPVSPDFNPESELYLEAIGILASVPAAWLITTLVVLLIYLCTRCCDTRSNKKRKSRPIRCCLSFFALVTCVALAVGFLGNHVSHLGMSEFHTAAQNVHHILSRSQEMANKYNENLMSGIEKNINHLHDKPFRRELDNRFDYNEIISACRDIFDEIPKGLDAMDELRFQITDPNNRDRMNFKNLPRTVDSIEKYRWPATMALQALFTFFCLLLFVGAIVHSRCILIVFSVCGLFSIILLYLLASLYTGVSVSMADFCHAPAPWIKHVLYRNLQIDEGVSTYYLECKPGASSPFDSHLEESRRAIQDIDRQVRIISSKARSYYAPLELNPYLDELERASEETVKLIQDLTTSLNCEPINRSYNTALVAFCSSGLFGLILMLLSMVASGLLFTILVWCNSHTWIYFKHKGRYIKVDDADPYMPLSTIERPRLTPSTASLGPSIVGPSGGSAPPPTYGSYARTRQLPPTHMGQTPPYAGTLNGSSRYGHLAGGGPATLQYQRNMATMGRTPQQQQQGGYQGLDNLPATMTLGRRGDYGRLRGSGRQQHGHHDNEAPLLGPNTGQYATLSKQCKTLESSDFY